jgi:nucleoid DNA-binding protein
MVYGTAYKHMMMRMEGRVADGVYIGATPPEIIFSAIDNIKTGITKRINTEQKVEINSLGNFVFDTLQA